MLSAAAVAAALCSVAVAASTAGVAVHPSEGFGPHGRLATIGGLVWPAGEERTAVTGDGRIYVAATPGAEGVTGPVRVRRYLPGGRLDPSFGIAGSTVVVGLGGGFGLAELLVDTNGLPYLVGTTGDGELVVARLGTGGALDPTYRQGGVAHLGPAPITTDRPRATIDQENRVVVATAGSVERLTPNGVLDRAFATDGVAPLPAGEVEGLGVDGEGNVQLAIPAEDGRGFRLMRLDDRGRAGVRTFDGIGGVRAMAVEREGGTLVVGTPTGRDGDGVTVPVLWIGPRVTGRSSLIVERSSARLRGRGDVTEVLSDPDGDTYLLGDHELIDLDWPYEVPNEAGGMHAGGEVDFFGRNGRDIIAFSGQSVATGAAIADSDGAILVDGISRPRTGGPAHGFIAKFPAAEHVITYAPEPPRGGVQLLP
jgi:hypothetical protein